jgi:hypothetical protein
MHRDESCECGVCKIPHFERNHYFHGKTLSARDLAAEQRYFNEKRWLLNRMITGWGIVCGLNVGLEDGCLVVTPGLALDCCGHEILVCDRARLGPTSIAEMLQVDPCGHETARFMICLEYHECPRESVRLSSCCDRKDGGHDYNRIRDDYRLIARPFDPACVENFDRHCCPYEGLGSKTSIYHALASTAVECPRCPECECLVLATGVLKPQQNGVPTLSIDEHGWRHRRLVYTNRALGGLLHCFHGGLAHITGMSWDTGQYHSVHGFQEHLEKGLTLFFDRPLDENSVTRKRTCRLTAIIPCSDNGCPKPVIIPVKRIEYREKDGYHATYHFDHECAERELRKCRNHPGPIELDFVLHGSLVRDQHGRALDAEMIHGFPTGNGVEGGEFLAFFRIQPQHRSSQS